MELIMRIAVRNYILKPYMWGLIFMHRITGLQPDYDKVAGFISKYCVSIKQIK